jgi:hypothetical protein
MTLFQRSLVCRQDRIGVNHEDGKPLLDNSCRQGQHLLQIFEAIDLVFARNGKIRSDGRMVHDMYLVQVKAPGDVKQSWDYYNVKEIIAGDEAFQPLSSTRCRLRHSDKIGGP